MNESDCIFCKIVRKEIPAREVAREADAVAFSDLNPKAPTHVLVIPARHAANLGDFASQASPHELGNLLALAAKVGREASPSGYRVVINEGLDAGQSVFHLHLHVLAGRALAWPPG
ncbi:MAG: histidine triad nucleotide-binding protein [Candidatus Eremiobacteraeota bacterium]|nr:histidine triad nucleotide-binding protein [Candidatus Eremiobacteraeota bacterium]